MPQTDFSQVCQSCHQMDTLLSHPVGFVPSESIPDAFPLQNGRITCVTCHDTRRHDGKPGDTMLRTGLAGEAFCTQCHQSFPGKRQSYHGMGVGKAHLLGANRQAHSVAVAAAPLASATLTSGLDEESTTCMTCHDGLGAVDAGGGAMHSIGEFQANAEHPIGVAYPKHSSRSSDATFVDSHKLDPRIRLFASTVGCGSCHSVYSKQNKLLVMDNYGSRLCLGCHQY